MTEQDRQAALIGREREMRELAAACSEAMEGRGSLYLLSGEPGMGKTRLATEIGREASSAGARVVWGRCWDGAGPAYLPWTDILRRLVRGTSVSVPPAIAASLAGGAAVATDASDLASDGRFELFDAIRSFLAAEADIRPLVLIFDDLHWSDISSLHMLGFLAREIADMPIMCVASYRDLDLDARPEAAQAIGALVRHGRDLSLRGLTDADVITFVGLHTGTTIDPDVAARLRSATGGNPFFLDEVTRLLASEGRLTDPDLSGLRLPRGVREAVRARLSGTPDMVRRMLTVAAVIGREFPSSVVQNVCGLGAAEMTTGIEAATAAGLLEAVPVPLGMHSFAHDVLRETIYEDVPASKRPAIHRQVGEALELFYAEDLGSHVSELAHHFSVGVSSETRSKAVDYATQAGDRALAAFAFDDAAALFELALTSLGMSDLTTRLDLLLRSGDAYLRAGNRDATIAAFAAAGDIARRNGDATTYARAALGVANLGMTFGRVDERTLAMLHEASNMLGDGDSAQKARVDARLANEAYYSDDQRSGFASSARALAMARRVGDKRALAEVLKFHIWAGLPPEANEERVAASIEARDLALQNGDRELVFHTAHRLFLDLLERGDPAFELELGRMRSLAEATGRPLWRSFHLGLDAVVELMRDRADAADRLANESLAVGLEAEDQNALAAFGGRLFCIRREQGRLEELVDPLRDWVKQFPAAAWRAGLALSLARAGRLDEARAEFDRATAAGLAGIARNDLHLATLAILTETAHVLGLSDDRMDSIYGELERLDGKFVLVGWCGVLAPVAYFMALIDMGRGRTDEAAAHLDKADQLSRRIDAHAPLRWIAQARIAAGKPVVRVGDATQAMMVLAGDFWDIRFDRDTFRLRDAKGLAYLHTLLGAAGTEFHVLDLSSPGTPIKLDGSTPDAILDPRAKAAYGQRVDELRDAIDEAESFGDAARAELAREELDAIAEQLAGAVGLGGRDRLAATAAERSRVNVTRVIKRAIDRIDAQSPTFARYLSATIHTGVFCRYEPDPGRPVDWQL